MFAIEDLLHPFRARYRTSPTWFKRSVGALYGNLPRTLRYGRELARLERLLSESQWWSPGRLRAYQWEQLRQLLEHAYENVPYYRRTWSEAGVSPRDIRSQADMHKLPYLTKEQVRGHKQELVARTYGQRLVAANTGGSTGEPLEFYWERGRTRAAERAFMWRQWRWAGFRYGDHTAVLRGQTVKERIHFDPIDNHLFLSTYDLNDETAGEYIAALAEFQPVSLQGYPSSVVVLANQIERCGASAPVSLKVVLAGSENLYPAQRARIEQVFKCRAYSWYGHGESVCLAGGCELSDAYHVYPEYGYVELADADGHVLEWAPQTRGEIVGTGLNNWAMPLIRYRTGDFAIAAGRTCECGRPYPLFERIDGRKQEYVVGVGGQIVPVTALIFGQHHEAFSKLHRMQIVQDRPAEIVVRLMCAKDWGKADEKTFNTGLQTVLGAGWKVAFEYVQEMELTRSGKHRFVIQNIPLENVWASDCSS